MTGRALIGPGIFRFFLAIIVFVHHASRIALGGAAVELFFSLSGFWICKMWLERYVLSVNPLVTYIISRWWRLIPTFLLVVACTLIFQHFVLGRTWMEIKGASAWPHFLASHLFILGYNTLAVQPLVPAWSLDVEMQFYMVAPLMICLAMRAGGTALIVGAAVTSLTCAVSFGPHVSATFAIFFALGIAAARSGWHPDGRLAALTATMTLALVAVIVISPWRGALLGGEHPGPLFRYSESINIVVALLALPYALFTTRQHGGAHDRMFADLSYIVYLLHWLAIEWLRTVISVSVWLRMLDFMFIFIITIGGAWVIWRFYDRPLNRARARWVAKRVMSGSPPIGPFGAGVEP